MKIEFEQKSKEEILIIGIQGEERKDIGHIFTPAGSGETNLNAIQICGFDEAFDLWGCAVYGDKKSGVMKKDIQLGWHGLYDRITQEEARQIVKEVEVRKLPPDLAKERGRDTYEHKIMIDRFGFNNCACSKCYNYPCTCENIDKYDNAFTVKREQDLNLEKKKEDKKKNENK